MGFDLVYASDLSRVLRESRAILVDIRMREDYAKGHWPSAYNYSYGELEAGLVRLPANRLVVLYCEHGGSSMQLARALSKEGLKVATVVGGYEAMRKEAEKGHKNF